MRNNYQIIIAAKPVEKDSLLDIAADTIQPLQNPTGVLVLLLLVAVLIGNSIWDYFKKRQSNAQLKLEKLKNHDLARKLKLALNTLSEIERNPDLVHSREFNLDYLSMRMDEQVFRDVILAQIKVNLKQKVCPALMPQSPEEREDKTAPRKVDVVFDVSYKPDHQSLTQSRVLFRIEIKLAKMPTQGSNSTIKDLALGLENFIVATETNRNWQPTIQGRIATISWDQKAKPTPLLVIEQTNEGSNVSFRSKRM